MTALHRPIKKTRWIYLTREYQSLKKNYIRKGRTTKLIHQVIQLRVCKKQDIIYAAYRKLLQNTISDVMNKTRFERVITCHL